MREPPFDDDRKQNVVVSKWRQWMTIPVAKHLLGFAEDDSQVDQLVNLLSIVLYFLMVPRSKSSSTNFRDHLT